MDTDKFLIVDYSDKAIAVPGEYDTCLQDEYKLIGGRFNSKLKFGAGWIFSKKKNEEQIKHLFATYGVIFASVALSDIVSESTSANKPGSLPEYITTDKNDVIVELEDGEKITISDRPLTTEFLFGYSDYGQGPTSEECHAAANKARTDENYFISENLSDLQSCKRRCEKTDGVYSETDKQRLIVAYNHALELREKRCRAYLKRYGLSKIKVSTYWMDR